MSAIRPLSHGERCGCPTWCLGVEVWCAWLMEWSWTRSPPGCLWVTPHGRGAFDAAISIDAAHIKQQLRAELGPAAIAKRLSMAA
jgi:hypothetical protein